MGIVGWADAPNSIDNQAVSKPASQTPTPPAGIVQPVSSEEVMEETLDGDEGALDDPGYEYNEVSAEMPVGPSSLWDEENPDNDTSKASYELIEAIRNLKLSWFEDDNRCDISKFELHEIKFLFDHAERCGFADYYDVVREVFGVKHRILDERGDIDSITSPNLDELMSFVEAKYERSFGGDEG